MPIDLDQLNDFDQFAELDMNGDMVIDATDLQLYMLSEYGTYSLTDLNHNAIMDQFDLDLNNDGLIDQFQADLDHNSIIDRFELDMSRFGGVKWDYDLNGDGIVDEIDRALARVIF